MRLTVLSLAASFLFLGGAASARESIGDLLASVRTSTTPYLLPPAEQAAMELTQRAPRTAGELKSLLAALDDEKTAPYAQISISSTTDKALGPALHAELKRRLRLFPRISDAEFARLNDAQKKTLRLKAMALANVAYALGRVGYKPAIEDIRSLLAFDHEFQGVVSLAASESLGLLGDKASADAIIHQEAVGGGVTLSGFGLWGAKRALDEINEIWESVNVQPLYFMDPRHRQLSHLAADLPGYARRGDPQLKEAFRRLLYFPDPGDSDGIRLWAGYALMLSMDPTDKALTREMLRHPDGGVRMNGVKSLRVARTWDPSFLPVLIDMLEHDPDYTVRRTVLEEFGALEIPPLQVRRREMAAAIPYVEKLLYNKRVSFDAFFAYRALTGYYKRYPGMSEIEEKTIRVEPTYQPEGLIKPGSGDEKK